MNKIQLLVAFIISLVITSCELNDENQEICGQATPIRVKDETKTDGINYILVINGKNVSVDKDVWSKYKLGDYTCIKKLKHE